MFDNLFGQQGPVPQERLQTGMAGLLAQAPPVPGSPWLTRVPREGNLYSDLFSGDFTGALRRFTEGPRVAMPDELEGMLPIGMAARVPRVVAGAAKQGFPALQRNETVQRALGRTADVLDAGEVGMSGLLEMPGFATDRLPSLAVRDAGVSPTRRTIAEVGDFWDADFLARNQRQGSYDNMSDVRRMFDNVEEEVAYQLQQEVTGEGWYDDNIRQTWRLSGQAFPVLRSNGGGMTTPAGERLGYRSLRQWMSAIGAASSIQTQASENWGQAMSIFDGWQRTGRIPLRKATGTQWGLQSKAYALGLLDTMAQRMGVRAALRWLNQPHTIQELREMRAYIGLHAPTGGTYGVAGQRDKVVPGIYIIGPKVGPFQRNINGVSDGTIDLWGTRQGNRHMGRMRGPNRPVDEALKDQPSDRERVILKDMYDQVGNRHGLSQQDGQAVGWFFEQNLFNAMGVRNAKPQTFAQGAQKWLDGGWGWQ
tara:strand:+ start:17501 stop:18937 length:1437 start_codon:yes stop_codon:yes gene_type:complete